MWAQASSLSVKHSLLAYVKAASESVTLEENAATGLPLKAAALQGSLQSPGAPSGVVQAHCKGACPLH